MPHRYSALCVCYVFMPVVSGSCGDTEKVSECRRGHPSYADFRMAILSLGAHNGASAVPSLVDSLGYFFKNEDEFLNSNFTLADVEKELTAQIERALQSGLKISYMDPHMGVAFLNPQLTALTEKLAKKYNLGLSTLGRNTYYDEDYKDMWAIPVEKKQGEFLKHLNKLKAEKPISLSFTLPEGIQRWTYLKCQVSSSNKTESHWLVNTASLNSTCCSHLNFKMLLVRNSN